MLYSYFQESSSFQQSSPYSEVQLTQRDLLQAGTLTRRERSPSRVGKYQGRERLEVSLTLRTLVYNPLLSSANWY